MMDLYEWSNWPNFYPVVLQPIPLEEMSLVLENDELRIFSSPVRHLIPNIGLRIEFAGTNKTLTYSSDTEPCPEVARLATGVDVLVHEATGATPGHSSAAQAGQVASQAGAGSLYLIHYDSRNSDPQLLVEAASQFYSGPVKLTKDFMELEF
jgi:ribonuclease Z